MATLAPSLYPRGRSLSTPGIPPSDVPTVAHRSSILHAINSPANLEVATTANAEAARPDYLRSQSLSPAPNAGQTVAAVPLALAPARTTGPSGLTQQLQQRQQQLQQQQQQQQPKSFYSPIHIQAQNGGIPAPAPVIAPQGRTLSGDGHSRYVAGDEPDSDSDSEGDDNLSHNSPFIARKLPRRERSRHKSWSPRFRARQAAESSPTAQSTRAVAGLPPPLSHVLSHCSTASNISPSHGTSTGSTINSTRTSISDSGNAPNTTGGLPRPRSSFSSPQPAAAATSLSSRRYTLTDASLAALGDETPDNDAYVTLLQKLLQRTTPPTIDIFRVDTLGATDNSNQRSTATQIADPAASTSAATAADTTRDDSSQSLLLELRNLAESYRDELVLERFHRKQMQTQLRRRVSLAVQQQQQQQARGHSATEGGQSAGTGMTSPLPRSTASPALPGQSMSPASSNTHSLSLPPGSGLLSITPPPSGLAGLAPSHFELALDLKSDEYEQLSLMFDRFKSQATAKLAAAAEYTATLEATVATATSGQSSSQSVLSNLQAQLTTVTRERTTLQTAHEELSRRHFTLGHKYASIKQSYLELPNQFAQIDQLTNRLHEVESESAAYRDQTENLKHQLQVQMHTLTADLSDSQTQLASSRSLVTSLQQQLTLQTRDRTTQSSHALDEMKALLEHQKQSSAIKLAAINDQFTATKKTNASLTQRVLELEIQLAQPSSSSATSGAPRRLSQFGTIDETNASSISGSTNIVQALASSNLPLSPAATSTSSSLAAAFAFASSVSIGPPASAGQQPDSQRSSLNQPIPGQQQPFARHLASHTPSRFDTLGRNSPAALAHTPDARSTRSPFGQTAPIPIGVPSPQNYRPRSSSRGVPLLHTPPHDKTSNQQMPLAFQSLPQPAIGLGLGSLGNVAGHGHRHTSSGGHSAALLIPPHEQRHAHRRASIQGSSSDEELIERQFSPTPNNYKSRVFTPPPA